MKGEGGPRRVWTRIEFVKSARVESARTDAIFHGGIFRARCREKLLNEAATRYRLKGR